MERGTIYRDLNEGRGSGRGNCRLVGGDIRQVPESRQLSLGKDAVNDRRKYTQNARERDAGGTASDGEKLHELLSD